MIDLASGCLFTDHTMQLGLTDHVLVVLVGFFALAPLIWTASLPRELAISNSVSSLAALELKPKIGLPQPDQPQPLESTQTRRRRSYKTDGDAYIRFGKRTQSLDQTNDLASAEVCPSNFFLKKDYLFLRELNSSSGST